MEIAFQAEGRVYAKSKTCPWIRKSVSSNPAQLECEEFKDKGKEMG